MKKTFSILMFAFAAVMASPSISNANPAAGKVMKAVGKAVGKALRDGGIYDAVKRAADSKLARDFVKKVDRFGMRRSAQARRTMEKRMGSAKKSK